MSFCGPTQSLGVSPNVIRPTLRPVRGPGHFVRPGGVHGIVGVFDRVVRKRQKSGTQNKREEEDSVFRFRTQHSHPFGVPSPTQALLSLPPRRVRVGVRRPPRARVRGHVRPRGVVSGDAERSSLPGDGRRGGPTHVAHTPQSATHSTRVDQVRVPSEHAARAQTHDGHRRRPVVRDFTVIF